MNFIPYGKQSISQEDLDSVINSLKSDYLTTGPTIQEFENTICEYVGAKYAVAVANGTAALHLASLVLLKKDDLVLTTPNSFVATSNSILYANAKPIFVDIDKCGNIDLDKCEKILANNENIKHLFCVHFSGNPINQTKLKYLKEKYNITVLEDCAHSLGASYNDIKAGSCINSECSILSFHPVKHLTTGEGGAITTNSERIYNELIKLRAHGIIRKNFKNTKMAYDSKGNINPWYYEMNELGYNYRITDFQCALGISQFNKLDTFILKRKKIAKQYDEYFKNTQIKPLYEYTNNSSYHLYVVQIDFKKLNTTKAELFNAMKNKNIGLQLHYIPINKQEYYKKLGYGKETTPNMDYYYENSFSLPIYPDLSNNEQKYVVDSILECIK